MTKIELPNTYMVVGERLLQIRKNKGKSLDEAAAEAGIPVKTLSKIEQGMADFRILTLAKLCRAYDIGPDKLLKGIDFGLTKIDP